MVLLVDYSTNFTHLFGAVFDHLTSLVPSLFSYLRLHDFPTNQQSSTITRSWQLTTESEYKNKNLRICNAQLDKFSGVGRR